MIAPRKLPLAASQRGSVRRKSSSPARRKRSAMDPLIITVAPVGAELTPDQTPHLPVTPEQLGETPHGAQRPAPRSFTSTAATTTAPTPTTSSASEPPRRDPRAQRPHRAVLDRRCDRHDARGAGRAAGAAARDGDADLRHGQLRRRHLREQLSDHARDLGRDARAIGVRPELEIFDLGHLSNARRLARRRHANAAAARRFRAGVPGGLDAGVEHLVDCVRALPRGLHLVGRRHRADAAAACHGRRSRWAATCGSGSKTTSSTARARLARNDELVARVARIGAELGRPVATPAQARAVLAFRRGAGQESHRRACTPSGYFGPGGLAHCSRTSSAARCSNSAAAADLDRPVRDSQQRAGRPARRRICRTRTSREADIARLKHNFGLDQPVYDPVPALARPRRAPATSATRPRIRNRSATRSSSGCRRPSS